MTFFGGLPPSCPRWALGLCRCQPGSFHVKTAQEATKVVGPPAVTNCQSNDDRLGALRGKWKSLHDLGNVVIDVQLLEQHPE